MSNLLVGILYAIPYIVTAMGMVLVSRHSDKHRERRGHVAFGLAWGGACMMACILLTGHAPTWGFVAISLVGAGSYGMLGPFWAIPTETLPRSVSGPAMGLVNALGNLGGYFGPLAVGFVFHRTGDFRYAFALLSLAISDRRCVDTPFALASRRPRIEEMRIHPEGEARNGDESFPDYFPEHSRSHAHRGADGVAGAQRQAGSGECARRKILR